MTCPRTCTGVSEVASDSEAPVTAGQGPVLVEQDDLRGMYSTRHHRLVGVRGTLSFTASRTADILEKECESTQSTAIVVRQTYSLFAQIRGLTLAIETSFISLKLRASLGKSLFAV